jgi:predicted lipoprotein
MPDPSSVVRCSGVLRPLGLGLLLTGALACSSTGTPDTRRELLSTWSTELIVSSYRELEQESLGVAAALDALCATPNAETLSAAQGAWTLARETLKEAEVFNFGPYSRPEFRIGPKIDSWPARPDDVEELLASEAPVDAASVAALGVWQKGLPVIEYLIYAPDGMILERLVEPRRCEYLRSVGAELVTRARELHLAWAPEGGDFAGQLSGAGRTSTAFRSLRDAFGEIVNRLGFTVENVRRDKLGRPLGDAAGSLAVPEAAESRFSGRSIADIHDNLDGIERVFFGDAARNVPGVSGYARERGRDFDAEMLTSLAASRAALDAIEAPLTEAVTTSPELVREASARLGELQNLLQVDLIGALGLSLDFNDNDGD